MTYWEDLPLEKLLIAPQPKVDCRRYLPRTRPSRSFPEMVKHLLFDRIHAIGYLPRASRHNIVSGDEPTARRLV